MRSLESRLTQKGQVTIPAEIRARLGLKPRDRVRFEIEGEVIVIKPATSTLLAGYGAVQGSTEGPDDLRVVRAAVEAAIADDVRQEA